MRGTVTETSSHGWLLVGLILLLTVTSIGLVGVTVFLSQHLRVTGVRYLQTKAFYLAQAGIMRALYDVRRGAGVSLGEQTVEAGPGAGTADDNVYTIQPFGSGSQHRDVLLMNMRSTTAFDPSPDSYCGLTRDRFEQWPVRNVLASGGATFVVQSITVNSNAPAGSRVIRIDLNGTGADWRAPGCAGGCSAATCGVGAGTLVGVGTPVDLSSVAVGNRSVAPGAAGRWSNNRIWFSTAGTMSGQLWVDVTFTMAAPDSSSRTARWDRLVVANRTADFTIKSVGEVRRGALPFVGSRRIQAEYRICTVPGAPCASEANERIQWGSIMSYQERMQLTAP